jgi:hypothetical protein
MRCSVGAVSGGGNLKLEDAGRRAESIDETAFSSGTPATAARQTYNEFLQAEEGIASNILADRLRKLQAAGIVEKRRDAFIAGVRERWRARR